MRATSRRRTMPADGRPGPRPRVAPLRTPLPTALLLEPLAMDRPVNAAGANSEDAAVVVPPTAPPPVAAPPVAVPPPLVSPPPLVETPLVMGVAAVAEAGAV